MILCQIALQSVQQCMRILHKSGAKIDLQNDQTVPLLHFLAEGNYYAAVDTLLELGASVVCISPNGDSPLHVAARAE